MCWEMKTQMNTDEHRFWIDLPVRLSEKIGNAEDGPHEGKKLGELGGRVMFFVTIREITP